MQLLLLLKIEYLMPDVASMCIPGGCSVVEREPEVTLHWFSAKKKELKKKPKNWK